MHGASIVGFALAHMLDFKLMPRLKNIGSAKLYRPAVGEDGRRPIRQDLAERAHARAAP